MIAVLIPMNLTTEVNQRSATVSRIDSGRRFAEIAEAIHRFGRPFELMIPSVTVPRSRRDCEASTMSQPVPRRIAQFQWFYPRLHRFLEPPNDLGIDPNDRAFFVPAVGEFDFNSST